MTTYDRWTLTVHALLGCQPQPAALPGRVFRAADRPLTEEELQGVTSPTELGLLLGISRQAAMQRMRRERP